MALRYEDKHTLLSEKKEIQFHELFSKAVSDRRKFEKVNDIQTECWKLWVLLFVKVAKKMLLYKYILKIACIGIRRPILEGQADNT